MNQSLYGPELDEIAGKIYEEYEMNMNAVDSTFNQFIYHYEAGDKAQNDVANDLARMLRIKYRNNAPRRPPKVMLIGPPGSGRTTQAQLVADGFGLVLVSPTKILLQEAEKNPAIKIKMQEALETGVGIPDEILLRLIDQRIRQSDCRLNGWVLDGFPETESQVNLLKSMRIKPSLVCIFEQGVEESVRKLAQRRVDPMTGELFNMEINPPKIDSQSIRLVARKEDEEDIVRKRFETWNTNITQLEENFKNCLLSVTTDRLVEQVFDQIKEAVENPIF